MTRPVTASARSPSDIPAQNLNGDGSLGSSEIFVDGFEPGGTDTWPATVPEPGTRQGGRRLG